MPLPQPAPWDRYHDQVPPCAQLEAAIAEAEYYLSQAQLSLDAARTAQTRAEADLRQAQAARDAAVRDTDTAKQARGGYDGVVDGFVKARQHADAAVANAYAAVAAATRQCHDLAALVSHAASWLAQLKQALGRCPPKQQKQGGRTYPPPPDGPLGDPVPGEPGYELDDDSCDALEDELAADQERLADARLELWAAQGEADDREDEYNEARARWSLASEALHTAAQRREGAGDSHVRGPGGYVKNPAFWAADAALTAAKEKEESARINCELARQAWLDAAARVAALEHEIADLNTEIGRITEALTHCSRRVSMLPQGHLDGGGGAGSRDHHAGRAAGQRPLRARCDPPARRGGRRAEHDRDVGAAPAGVPAGPVEGSTAASSSVDEPVQPVATDTHTGATPGPERPVAMPTASSSTPIGSSTPAGSSTTPGSPAMTVGAPTPTGSSTTPTDSSTTPTVRRPRRRRPPRRWWSSRPRRRPRRRRRRHRNRARRPTRPRWCNSPPCPTSARRSPPVTRRVCSRPPARASRRIPLARRRADPASSTPSCPTCRPRRSSSAPNRCPSGDHRSSDDWGEPLGGSP